MNIRKLYNPKTINYNNFKKKVLAGNFKWEYLDDTLGFGTDNPSSEDCLKNVKCLTPEQKKEKNWGGFPMYHHCILQRAEAPVATAEKPCIPYKQIYFPTITGSQQLALEASAMVCDILEANRIRLYNFLMYFTDAGGETFVQDGQYSFESYDPQEDDCVIFDGTHYHETPKEKRRVVLVVTYA